MHWTDQFASKARVDALVPSITDPVSGQPALKNTAARIERYAAAAYAFAVVKEKPAKIEAEYWAIAKCEGGWRVELAFGSHPEDWHVVVSSLLGGPVAADTIAYRDSKSTHQRYVRYDGDQLRGALFISGEPVAVSRSWAVEQLSAKHTGLGRFAVIAGRPGSGTRDKGATVCSCFGVGANEIAACVATGCATVAAVGTATQAGTNCGSCRAEIQAIIEAHMLQAAE